MILKMPTSAVAKDPSVSKCTVSASPEVSSVDRIVGALIART
jgi:hypothetical protein